MLTEPTSSERLTALELERRRRGLRNLDELDQVTTYKEREEIVAAYIEQKQGMVKRKYQQCRGCSYRVRGSCSFHLTGKLRRKDAEGMCMEYTQEKRRRRRDEQ